MKDDSKPLNSRNALIWKFSKPDNQVLETDIKADTVNLIAKSTADAAGWGHLTDRKEDEATQVHRHCAEGYTAMLSTPLKGESR